MTICLLFMLPKNRGHVSQVTRFLLFEMVFHNETTNFKFALQR